MITDSEIRIELKRLHNQAMKVCFMLEKREGEWDATLDMSLSMRRKLLKRAWKITNLTWPLERDGMKEYKAL